MKLLFFLGYVFFANATFGQSANSLSSNTLDGFLGIKFGASIDAATKTILAKPGCRYDPTESDSTIKFFKGLTFGGRETSFIALKFIDRKFYQAAVFIDPELESKTVELYNDIKNDISDKYYKSTEDFELYDSPYEKDDGYTESAIKLGKATFETFWKFSTADNDFPNYISLKITETLHIEISYEDGLLAKEASSRNKERNSKDY